MTNAFVWVSRDDTGSITGVFSEPKPTYAGEAIGTSNSEVISFLSKVPQSVTPRQFRLALSSAGLLTQANAAIQADDESVQITWDYSLVINRTDPFIESLGIALGLSTKAIDEMFVTAASL